MFFHTRIEFWFPTFLFMQFMVVYAGQKVNLLTRLRGGWSRNTGGWWSVNGQTHGRVIHAWKSGRILQVVVRYSGRS